MHKGNVSLEKKHIYTIELIGSPGVGKTAIKKMLIRDSINNRALPFYGQEYATCKTYLSSLSRTKKIALLSLRRLLKSKVDNFTRKSSIDYCKANMLDKSLNFSFEKFESIYLKACNAGCVKSSRLRAVEFFHNTLIDYSAMLLNQNYFMLKEKQYSPVIVYDEGFSQRAISLKNLGVQSDLLAQYCLNMPKPDCLFVVEVPESIRIKRLIGRGSDLARFPMSSIEHADTVQCVKDAVLLSGKKVFVLDGEKNVSEIVKDIVSCISVNR